MYAGFGAVGAIQSAAAQATEAMQDIARAANFLKSNAAGDEIRTDTADRALRFATVVGPRLISEAVALPEVDASVRLTALQKSTRGILNVVKSEVPSVMIAKATRFATMVLFPVGTLAAESVNDPGFQREVDRIADKAKEELEKKDLALKIALGIAGLVGIAYFVRAFK